MMRFSVLSSLVVLLASLSSLIVPSCVSFVTVAPRLYGYSTGANAVHSTSKRETSNPAIGFTSPSGRRRLSMGLPEVKVTKNPSEEEIKKLGARDWPTWSCEVSKFPWTYEGTEICLLLEGDVTVTPDDDRVEVTIGPGDLCVFPDGMKCTWDVRVPVKKHYMFT